MASWMVHLRIANYLIYHFPKLSEPEFIVGNLAPDSGVPNADWSDYSPSSVISHFKENIGEGRKSICIDKFLSSYFTKEIQKKYSREEFSFFLGYLSHLLTDILWVKNVFPICISKSPEEYASDPKGIIWKWKRDFFDLDALYLLRNPGFRAFNIYESAVGFENKYMDIFPSDAFDKKREYIVSFYKVERKDLCRDYFYLNEKEMSDFVTLAAQRVKQLINEYSFFNMTV